MLRWLIAAALFAAAAWSGFRSWKAAQGVMAAKGWTRAPATITESRIEEVKAYNGDSGSETVFEPRVSYAYEVNGAAHTGSRISLDGEAYPTRGGALKRLAAYPAGGSVEALVDPADPSRSCLAAHADINLLAPLAFLLIGLIAASGVLGA